MTAPSAAIGTAPTVSEGSLRGAAGQRGRAPAGGSLGAAEGMISKMGGGAETWLALAVVVVVALLIVPLPAVLLDALLATSFAISVLILLVTLSVSDPLEFSIFPSLLLLVTLLRLGLNVNSTRLILSHGHAGEVIAAFGNAVIGGNYIVGLVIFLILIVINFMVITKGAGRVAEVAARFTLDAMPGRQMSIDADLGAGLIDEAEARRRREEIQRYADFYGAMDGSAKFVRGDAIAGLLITGINLIGGFLIGITQQGMTAKEALGTFTSLTVGDGLVTQIPALIVSTAAGIIVTYGSKSPRVGPAIAQQMMRHQGALWISSGILGLMGLAPGFPMLPFFLLSGLLAGGAWMVRAREERERMPDAVVQVKPTGKPESSPIKDLLLVEPLEVEVGYALVPLVDEAQKGDLLQRIGLMRKQLAVEMGIIVPPARIRDNIQLPATEYVDQAAWRARRERRGPAALPARARHHRHRRTDRRHPHHRPELRAAGGVDHARPARRGRSEWLQRGRAADRALHAPDGNHQAPRGGTPLAPERAGAARLRSRRPTPRWWKTPFPASSRSGRCTACCSACSGKVCRSGTCRSSWRRSPTPPRRPRTPRRCASRSAAPSPPSWCRSTTMATAPSAASPWARGSRPLSWGCSVHARCAKAHARWSPRTSPPRSAASTT